MKKQLAIIKHLSRSILKEHYLIGSKGNIGWSEDKEKLQGEYCYVVEYINYKGLYQVHPLNRSIFIYHSYTPLFRKEDLIFVTDEQARILLL